MNLKTSLSVSKWIKLPLLIDTQEMEALFGALPSFQIYDVQRVTSKGEGILSPDAFLSLYASYIADLKNGKCPPPLPSPVWSLIPEALHILSVEGERQLFKPILPVVQMQAHALRYSHDDRSFRSQLFGSDGIAWGLQLGYPQIYEEPKTHAILPTRDLPNGPLFRAIQQWVRHHTSPTPFVVEGVRQNVPARLGKACFSWINTHPDLIKKGITIERAHDTKAIC